MSLQYIIDGYNVVNHPSFNRSNNIQQVREKLVGLIKEKRLCGSPRNKVTVVFDGYPGGQNSTDFAPGINIIFSGDISADEKIKRLVENSDNPKNIIVVSDDNEIKSFVKSCGSRGEAAEDFIGRKKHPRAPESRDLLKTDLNYSQISKINKELAQRWLKT
jgi:predicted RNA-binding protein with PIN domain